MDKGVGFAGIYLDDEGREGGEMMAILLCVMSHYIHTKVIILTGGINNNKAECILLSMKRIEAWSR